MKIILTISFFSIMLMFCFCTDVKNENIAMKSHNIKRMMKNLRFDKTHTPINKDIIYNNFIKTANLKEYLTLNQSIEKKNTKWEYFSAIVFDSIQLSYLAFFECTDYDQDYGKLRRDNYISSYLLINNDTVSLDNYRYYYSICNKWDKLDFPFIFPSDNTFSNAESYFYLKSSESKYYILSTSPIQCNSNNCGISMYIVLEDNKSTLNYYIVPYLISFNGVFEELIIGLNQQNKLCFYSRFPAINEYLISSKSYLIPLVITENRFEINYDMNWFFYDEEKYTIVKQNDKLVKNIDGICW